MDTSFILGRAAERAELRRLLVSGVARETRRSAGLSQAEIARACGVSVSTVSRWEAGSRFPHRRAAKRYRRAIHELAESLATEESKTEPR